MTIPTREFAEHWAPVRGGRLLKDAIELGAFLVVQLLVLKDSYSDILDAGRMPKFQDEIAQAQEWDLGSPGVIVLFELFDHTGIRVLWRSNSCQANYSQA